MGGNMDVSAAQWRLVTAEHYVALYKRQTDLIYGTDSVDHWQRVYLTSDDQELAANGMGVVLTIFAHGRFKRMERPDLCVPSADEPFAELYPRDVLEDENPLHARKAALQRELAEVEQKIREEETK